MAKTSFAKKDTVIDVEATPVAAPEPADNVTTLATRPVRTVALLPSVDDMPGAWNRKDVHYPRINLVQKTSDGDLVKNFGIGAFVLSKSVKLSDGETPLTITALEAPKDYIQKVDFDSGETPVVFGSEEEVRANGGSTEYKDAKSGNYFQPRAHITLAVAAPEGISEEDAAIFPFDGPDGKAYALAIYTVVSSAFTSVGKDLATFRGSNKIMRQGLIYGQLALSSYTKKKDTKSWCVPVIKFIGATPPELVEFFLSLRA